MFNSAVLRRSCAAARPVATGRPARLATLLDRPNLPARPVVRTSRTARSRSSSGYLRGAGTARGSPSGQDHKPGFRHSTKRGSAQDIVYRHIDLVQNFHARAKTQDSTPTAMQELADENRQLKSEIDNLRGELHQEHGRSKTMR